LTARWDALLTIGKVNISGDRVTSMVQVPGQHERYRLSIHWPTSGQGPVLLCDAFPLDLSSAIIPFANVTGTGLLPQWAAYNPSSFLLASTYLGGWGNFPTNVLGTFLTTATYDADWGNWGTNVLGTFQPASATLTSLSTDNAAGLTNYISWTMLSGGSINVVFNGNLQSYTVTNPAGATFSGFTGSAGSDSYFCYRNIQVTASGVVWLTAAPSTVTNGVVSFTRFGTNRVGAYMQVQ
jgi:hypothetical protein